MPLPIQYSLTKATGILRWQDKIIPKTAVESVVGKIGRAESAIDPAPVNRLKQSSTSNPRRMPAGTTKEHPAKAG